MITVTMIKEKLKKNKKVKIEFRDGRIGRIKNNIVGKSSYLTADFSDESSWEISDSLSELNMAIEEKIAGYIK